MVKLTTFYCCWSKLPAHSSPVKKRILHCPARSTYSYVVCREVKVLSEKFRERASWFLDPFSRQVWSVLSLQLNFIALLSVWITRSSFPCDFSDRAFFEFFLIGNKSILREYRAICESHHTVVFKTKVWHFKTSSLKEKFEKFNDVFFTAQHKMSCFEIQQRQRRFFHSMVKKITFYELYM